MTAETKMEACAKPLRFRVDGVVALNIESIYTTGRMRLCCIWVLVVYTENL